MQVQRPVTQTNTEPIQLQKESWPSSAPLCPSDTHTVRDSGPSSVLQSFQDRFLQFSPERFQEVKAQAGALRGSRGMRVWNVAWLTCQEARQQLQERMQDADDVFQEQSHSDSWCERHYVDVVSTDVQTLSPGGQSLLVQSTPGPRHPQWQGIVSGEVDLRTRKPILSSKASNSTTAACSNVTVKPEDHSKESKVTSQSHHR